MKSLYVLLLALILLLQISCGKEEFIPKDNTILKTCETEKGKKLKIKFNRGKDWFHDYKLFTANLTIIPQFAVWTEDEKGQYLQTLYVTRCFAKQEWRFAKNKDDECIRTMSMPYWFNRYLGGGNKKPTKANPIPDAMSGATPTGSFILETVLNTDTGKVKIFVEINKSFDHYGEFTKERKESEFNGQPSIIYCAEIDLASDDRRVIFKPIGYGGESGDDAKLYKDLEKVKRAQTMVENITVEIL